MGSHGPELSEVAVLDGIERGYRDRLELDRELYADLEETLKGLKRYAAAARSRLVDHGCAYIGNNLVALAESAYDQLKRIEVVQEEDASSLTDVDIEDMYERIGGDNGNHR